mgnify:FL=1
MSKKVTKLYKNNVRINNPDGVRRLLQRVINSLLNDEISENKARVIGYLCNIMLKAFEVGELEERLTELEEMLSDKVG